MQEHGIFWTEWWQTFLKFNLAGFAFWTWFSFASKRLVWEPAPTCGEYFGRTWNRGFILSYLSTHSHLEKFCLEKKNTIIRIFHREKEGVAGTAVLFNNLNTILEGRIRNVD